MNTKHRVITKVIKTWSTVRTRRTAQRRSFLRTRILNLYYILNLYRTLLSIVYLNFIVRMLMSFYY